VALIARNFCIPEDFSSVYVAFASMAIQKFSALSMLKIVERTSWPNSVMFDGPRPSRAADFRWVLARVSTFRLSLVSITRRNNAARDEVFFDILFPTPARYAVTNEVIRAHRPLGEDPGRKLVSCTPPWQSHRMRDSPNIDISVSPWLSDWLSEWNSE